MFVNNQSYFFLLPAQAYAGRQDLRGRQSDHLQERDEEARGQLHLSGIQRTWTAGQGSYQSQRVA